MPPHTAPPDRVPLPDPLLASVVSAATSGSGRPDPAGIRRSDAHSNEVAMVPLVDGRTLVVKRGRFDWAAGRFEVARRASRLFHEAGIVAPRPLRLPAALDERPLEAYWRIESPTLEEVWPGMDPAGREAALRSLGRLVRRLHRTPLRGYGPLGEEGGDHRSLAEHLAADLGERLLPAASAGWEEGAPILEELVERLPVLAERVRDRPATLLHNDLHLGNVLCEVDGARVRCVGFLDLEASAAGVPESDLAILQTLHGALFARPLPGAWFARVREGYGGTLDPWTLHFFRVYIVIR